MLYFASDKILYPLKKWYTKLFFFILPARLASNAPALGASRPARQPAESIGDKKINRRILRRRLNPA